MKIVQDVFNVFREQLADIYEQQEIDAIASLVLYEKLRMSKAQLRAFPDTGIDEPDSKKIQEILQRLTTGEPVQYILGVTDFFDLSFVVTPDVLIPRPETEELVKWILDSVKALPKSTPQNILDIGTGSGCIAISLKKNLPNVSIIGIDISSDALDVADTNNTINETDVKFIAADILNTKSDLQLPKFDIIVSNPPYVTLTDKQQMHRNVTDFEPHTALFVPEDDPLIFYKAIADFAKDNLNDSGFLFFEINESLGKQTVELLQNKGFKNIELRQDMSGRDRMIKAHI